MYLRWLTKGSFFFVFKNYAQFFHSLKQTGDVALVCLRFFNSERGCCLNSHNEVYPFFPTSSSSFCVHQEEIGASNLGTCLTQNYGWTSTCGAHAAPPSNIVPGDVLVVRRRKMHYVCACLSTGLFCSITSLRKTFFLWESESITLLYCSTPFCSVVVCSLLEGPRQQLHGLGSPRHTRIRGGLRRHHRRRADYLPQH